MSDFSQPPLDVLRASRDRGYVGLHIEQGVPILDRDLNLLQDLIIDGVRSLFARYIGDGVPAGSDGFRIEPVPAAQDLRIAAGPGDGPGSCLVGGIDVPIPAPVHYSRQPNARPLTTPAPPQPNPRVDVVYLDAWLAEVDGADDDTLNNGHDVGMQTSTRLTVEWAVRVAEGAPMPAPDAGHVQCALARLIRPHGTDTVDEKMITDLRQRRLTVGDLEKRLSLVERVLLLPAFVPAPGGQFTPPSGVAGTPVTLNGVNFDVAALEVLFDDKIAQLVGAPSATQVVARVPTGLTPDGRPVQVRITVRNAAGASTSLDRFGIRPVLAFAEPGRQISPPRGFAGNEVTLTGFNFNAGTPTVTFGSTDARLVRAPTNTKLVVAVPDGLPAGGAATQDVKITVKTDVPPPVTTDDTFQVERIPVPAFAASGSQFRPSTGSANSAVTLDGKNFHLNPEVKFGDTGATLASAPTSNQLIVLVPAGLVQPGSERRVNITVTTRGGSIASTDFFTVRG